MTGTVKVDVENTAAYSGADLLETDVTTVNADIVKSYNDLTTFVVKTTGGTATLTNEKGATIGSKGTPVPVNVIGQASATATNAGTIFGATTVVAVDGSFGIGTLAQGKNESTKTFSVTVSKDDTTATTNEVALTFGDTEVGSTLAEFVVEATATGGKALFTNTGAAPET